ncbi:MAG TPA: hypothetical protein VKP65_21975 [Rhodothermales bacterium]|nr:hypothetical protein [Rhodothermales bacterium]
MGRKIILALFEQKKRAVFPDMAQRYLVSFLGLIVLIPGAEPDRIAARKQQGKETTPDRNRMKLPRAAVFKGCNAMRWEGIGGNVGS